MLVNVLLMGLIIPLRLCLMYSPDVGQNESILLIGKDSSGLLTIQDSLDLYYDVCRSLRNTRKLVDNPALNVLRITPKILSIPVPLPSPSFFDPFGIGRMGKKMAKGIQNFVDTIGKTTKIDLSKGKRDQETFPILNRTDQIQGEEFSVVTPSSLFENHDSLSSTEIPLFSEETVTEIPTTTPRSKRKRTKRPITLTSTITAAATSEYLTETESGTEPSTEITTVMVLGTESGTKFETSTEIGTELPNVTEAETETSIEPEIETTTEGESWITGTRKPRPKRPPRTTTTPEPTTEEGLLELSTIEPGGVNRRPSKLMTIGGVLDTVDNTCGLLDLPQSLLTNTFLKYLRIGKIRLPLRDPNQKRLNFVKLFGLDALGRGMCKLLRCRKKPTAPPQIEIDEAETEDTGGLSNSIDY